MAKTRHEEVFRVLLREKNLGKGNRSVLIDAVVLDELAEIPWQKSSQHVISNLRVRYGPCLADDEIADALTRLCAYNPQVELVGHSFTYLPMPIEVLGDVRWRVNPKSMSAPVSQFRESCARFCPNANWVWSLRSFVKALG